MLGQHHTEAQELCDVAEEIDETALRAQLSASAEFEIADSCDDVYDAAEIGFKIAIKANLNMSKVWVVWLDMAQYGSRRYYYIGTETDVLARIAEVLSGIAGEEQ